MGKVYRGFDQRLDRPVALKHIRADTSSTSARERFRREARSVARLNHPSIVQVYDWVETSEGDWLVMELVDGQSLKRLLLRGPLPPWRTQKIARQILSGLAIAHSAGIVHRDLKPDNIMLTAGDQVKILDFGLAKHVGSNDNEPALTIEGRLIGTVSAMSPEQAVGEAVDHRSDLFSLGTLLYESLTGVSPFHSDNKVQTLTRICTLQQRPVKDLRPEVVPLFSDIIDHLMEKDPDDRPHSALEVMSALDAMEEGSASGSEFSKPAHGIGGFAGTFAQDFARPDRDDPSSEDGDLRSVDPRSAPSVSPGWVTESAESPVEDWDSLTATSGLKSDVGSPSITTIEPGPSVVERSQTPQIPPLPPIPTQPPPQQADSVTRSTEERAPVSIPSLPISPASFKDQRPILNDPSATATGSQPAITISRAPMTETGEGPALSVVFRLEGGEEKPLELKNRRKSILDLAMDNEIDIYNECGGRARCSTCRIRVLDGLDNVLPRKPREAKLAERLGWEDEIRLACQTRVVGDVIVERLVRDSQDIGLLLDEHAQTLPAQEVTLAILSCEILDFDNFATKAPPYDQIHLLHRFLTQMGMLVGINKGRIQNYTGTGFRAFFRSRRRLSR